MNHGRNTEPIIREEPITTIGRNYVTTNNISRKSITKPIAIILTLILLAVPLTGCSEANRVSQNLSKQADNFNIVRQLTVINCIEGDVLYISWQNLSFVERELHYENDFKLCSRN